MLVFRIHFMSRLKVDGNLVKSRFFFQNLKIKIYKNSLFCKNQPLPRVLNENIGHIWHFHNLSFLDMIKYKTSSMRPEMSVFLRFFGHFYDLLVAWGPPENRFFDLPLFSESFLAHFRMNKHMGTFIPKVVQIQSS